MKHEEGKKLLYDYYIVSSLTVNSDFREQIGVLCDSWWSFCWAFFMRILQASSYYNFSDYGIERRKTYIFSTFKSNFLFLFPKKKTFKSYLTSWLQAWFTWTLKRYGKLHHFVSTHIVCRYPEDKIRKSYTHTHNTFKSTEYAPTLINCSFIVLLLFWVALL